MGVPVDVHSSYFVHFNKPTRASIEGAGLGINPGGGTGG
jgi:hypothetical protein